MKIKISKWKIILAFLIVILIGISVFIGCKYAMWINSNSNSNNSDNKTKNEIINVDTLIGSNEKRISSDLDYVSNLYSRIEPKAILLSNNIEETVFMKNTIVDASTINDEDKLLLATRFLKQEDFKYIGQGEMYGVYEIEKSKIDEAMSKMWCDSNYNENTEFIYGANWNNVGIGSGYFNYNADRNRYEGEFNTESSGFSAPYNTNIAQLDVATEDENHVYLYQNVIYLDQEVIYLDQDNDNSDKSDTYNYTINYKIYSDLNKNNFITNIVAYDGKTNSVNDINVLDYYGKTGVIKYTFNKKGNDYCLEKSQIIKE